MKELRPRGWTIVGKVEDDRVGSLVGVGTGVKDCSGECRDDVVYMNEGEGKLGMS